MNRITCAEDFRHYLTPERRPSWLPLRTSERHMQPRSEEFRAQAAECEALASYWGDLIKEQYQQLARQWLFLAEQVEAFGQCRQRVYARTNGRASKADQRQLRLASPQFKTSGPVQ